MVSNIIQFNVMSYTKLLYHIIFRTKRSIRSIEEEYEKELYSYILGFCRKKGCHLYRIGGMPDHIHMLVSIPPSISLSQFMKDLKVSTSKWLFTNINFIYFTGWGEGYGAFTYSMSDKDVVANYIANQKTHHAKVDFFSEFLSLLREHGIEPDMKYFMKD